MPFSERGLGGPGTFMSLSPFSAGITQRAAGGRGEDWSAGGAGDPLAAFTAPGFRGRFLAAWFELLQVAVGGGKDAARLEDRPAGRRDFVSHGVAHLAVSVRYGAVCDGVSVCAYRAAAWLGGGGARDGATVDRCSSHGLGHLLVEPAGKIGDPRQVLLDV